MNTRAAPGRWLRRLPWLALLLFAGLNVLAFTQAWRLTHFTTEQGPRPHPEQLSAMQRLKLVLTGLPNPRPRNNAAPDFPYQTVRIASPDGPLEAWYAPPGTGLARGTVALFHGYASSKGHLLHEAATFRALGWAVLLVDQEGSGGSPGVRTTIGYREAGEVAAAVRWLGQRPGPEASRPLVLYGISMGAAAIMRAEAELGVRPTANILECPYGTMRQTVINRFRAMRVPVALADLLVFWGGVQNGFWAYSLQPEEYARRIGTPTLLLWGTADQRVTPAETDRIFAHLAGPKERVDFAGSGHEPYWRKHPAEWRAAVAGWLGALPPPPR